MNVQAAPPPYTPVGGSNMAGDSPSMLGGLPPMQNPMAQQLQSMGRDEDTMLVHMTPNEVNSLQGLAMAAGGSLTINPQTGLPEASILKKLLPMIAGIGLNFLLPGSGLVASLGGKAATAGLMTGAASTAITGNLQKGLMAGLGAFGGASLAGGIQGALGGAANQGLKAGAGELTKGVTETAGKGLAKTAGKDMFVGASKGMANTMANTPGAASALNKTSGLFSQFGQAARGNMTGLAGKAAPMAAGMGVLNTMSEATAPQMPKYNPDDDGFGYVPMGPGKREVRFQTPEQIRESEGREFKYFTPTNPDPVPLYGQPRGFAEGGATSAPPQGFDELVQYFGASNPGAITAPSTYPATTPTAAAAPTPRKEVVHSFDRPARNATANNLGLGDTNGPYGTFDISNLNGLNFDSLRNNAGYAQLFDTAPSAPTGTQQSPSAPRLMSGLPGGEMWGGPTYVPAPTMSLEEEVDYSPGYGTTPSVFEGTMYQQYAQGGAVNMRDGSFVVDARTVSELGNGSSNAGIEMLSRMGGRPVRGPGDGVSDSVKASIGGKQEARVARDEVIFQPDAVRRLGGGSDAKGTQKLYAMMEKAHKARKKAKRGQDTQLRRGLA